MNEERRMKYDGMGLRETSLGEVEALIRVLP